VSIVIPVHNYGRFLGDALDSVLAQTIADWECIVVDDGSTDDSASVASSYVNRDSRFTLIRQQQRGVSAARNAGLGRASGAFIQFLDADDRLHPTKLERHVAFLSAHPETDIVYGEVTFFRTEAPDVAMHSLGGRLSRSLMARVHGADEALRKLEHYNIMPINAALVRRTLFDRVGTFDETSRGCEDWDLWLRAAIAGAGFDFEDDGPVASVRAHGGSATRDAERMMNGLFSVARTFSCKGRIPLIYQMASGVEAALSGRRRDGFRAIWSASNAATESLTAWRWRVYAIGALFLPGALYRRLVTFPIPERALEIYRSLRRTSS
jgi:glycosyltransferase involved in cell wall biosynthesis